MHATDDSDQDLNAHLQTLHLADEAATAAMGAALAPELCPGMTVFLCGDLGAGKSTLARGLIHALGYTDRVKSPTYNLVERYVISGLYLYHFDFYRFSDSRELRDAGFGEYFDERSVCLIEWPEKAGGALPLPDLTVALEFDDSGSRNALVSSETEAGHRCIEALKRRL